MLIVTTTPDVPQPAQSEPIDASLVTDIAAGFARATSLWEDRVRHDGATRHAVRLLVHERYEVWLIGWPAGHRTTPHDHGGSIGALAVVEGELVEHAGPSDDRGRRLGAGACVLIPSDAVHDVGTTDDPATSIHVYSPPLSTMTFYEDGTGLPDHVLAVTDEAPLLTVAEAARLLHPARGASRG